MPPKTSSAAFREILTSIQKREFAQIYILSGEEDYYIDKIAEALEHTVVADASDRDFNTSTFYGADANIEEVAAAARQFPMMVERRLVMLKEAQSMTDHRRQLERLTPYAEKPTSTTVLVITVKGDPLPSTSRLVKAAAKSGGIVFTSPRIRDYQLASPIKDYCRSLRVAIGDKAIAMLADAAGTSLKKIFGEIDKILVAESNRPSEITPEMIERNVGASKDFNSFELQSAIARRDYPKALRIADHFSRNPKIAPAPVIASALFGLFSRLAIAHSLRDRSDSSMMAALQAKSSYALREIRDAMAYYNFDQCRIAISAIRTYDANAKGIGSMQKEDGLLRELLFRIMTS